jgi:hypothetical protein
MIQMYDDNIQHTYTYVYTHTSTQRERKWSYPEINIHTSRRTERHKERNWSFTERVRVLIEQVSRLENSLPVANAKYPRRDAHWKNRYLGWITLSSSRAHFVVTIVWLCLWPSVTDGSQPLSGRVMCEHYWLGVLMYTPVMSAMTLLLKNRYERKWSREIFLSTWKRKCLWFFSLFLKIEFLPLRGSSNLEENSQGGHSALRTVARSGLVKGCFLFLSVLISFTGFKEVHSRARKNLRSQIEFPIFFQFNDPIFPDTGKRRYHGKVWPQSHTSRSSLTTESVRIGDLFQKKSTKIHTAHGDLL